MKKLIRFAAVLAAYICITASALAQNAGSATNHAFVLGKGAGNQGYTSLLCTTAQLVVGQAAADPICRTITGDVTISAGGVTAIGATVVHSAMLNADVFSTAHPWSAIQSFSTLIDLSAIAAPATPASGHGSAWFDSTDLRLHDKNASGTIGTTVVASTCATHQWDSSLSPAGVRTCTQPGFADISGSLATAQLPGLASALIWVGNGSGVATAVAMSQDCTISNAGVVTCLKTNNVAFGPFATIASQTSNVIYKGNGAAAPVASALTDDGTKVSTSENIDLTSKAAAIEVANAGTTGTTVNMLAKLSGAPSTALIAATTDAGGAVGIVVAGAGTTSSAIIAVGGTASCVFDGATVAGDYVQISGTITGNCHDAGSTYPTSGQVIGRVLSTNGAGGTFAVIINDEIRAAAGGGGGVGTVIITAGNGLGVSGSCNSSVSINCAVALTAPVSAANGGTGVVSPTAHTVPINEGASAQNNTGTGSVGQALVSNGASSDPTFQSGGWVLLNTLTASSSATLSDTTHITSAYNDYQMVFESILPATTNVNCQIQIHSGGSFQTTSYAANALRFISASLASAGATTNIPCSDNSADTSNAGAGISGEIILHNPSQTTSPKHWTGEFSTIVASGLMSVVSTGAWTGWNGAIDGFQILMSTGNIASGTIKIYGRL